MLSPPTVSHMCYLLVLTRDSDEKFNSMSIEYKKIIDSIRTATYDKPSIVNKHFANVSTLSRQQARQKSNSRKSHLIKNVKIAMKYNPRLPDLNSLLEKHVFAVYRPHFQKYFSTRLY